MGVDGLEEGASTRSEWVVAPPLSLLLIHLSVPFSPRGELLPIPWGARSLFDWRFGAATPLAVSLGRVTGPAYASTCLLQHSMEAACSPHLDHSLNWKPDERIKGRVYG